MARYDDLNTRAIAYGTFVSTVILLLLILGLRAMCYGWIQGEEQVRIEKAKYEAADTVLAEQRQLIESYGTIEVELPPPADKPDAEPTKVERIRIPVQRAAELFLEDLRLHEQRQAQTEWSSAVDSNS